MGRKQRLTLLATIVGSGVVVLDGTVVNLALPKIATGLHAHFSDLQWIVDGYLLSLSALILLGGSLGDILGRKKVYLVGLVGFGVSSLLCGLAPSTNILIATRVLQGVFGALLVPGALAIINTNFSASARGKAIGSWAAWLAIGPAVGPLLGGYILGIASWRWIFFINLPLVALCFLFAMAGIRESRDTTARHVDVKGALSAMLALAGITYGLIQGPANHWQVASVMPLVFGLGFTAIFLGIENSSPDPMVRLGLFKSRNFTGANLTTFAMYGALSGFLFAFIIYLQTHLHYSSLKAGASPLPIPILLFLFSRRVGALCGKYGPRAFMTAGPLFLAAGMAYLYRLSPGASYINGVLPGVILFAVGMVLAVAPLTITVMSSVERSSSGIASAINNAVTRVAGLIVVALLGLFGASNYYHFAIILSAGLAALAGVISYFAIQNHTLAIEEHT